MSIPVEQLIDVEDVAALSRAVEQCANLDHYFGVIALTPEYEYVLGELDGRKVLVPYDPNK
ncbi:MAG: hypothetical protein EHM41_00120 [Chloroflexi bacterium]|nr:MAG: hypothetical protein EHM41_00120 [Chloroflexota bacterium]